MSKYKVWLLLIACNLFWAGNYVFGKYVTAEMTPLWITFSRWLLAIIIFFPIAHYLEKPEWKKISKSWASLVFMGMLGIIGYNIAVYSALNYTSSTNAVLVNSLTPGTIVIFSVIILRERISKLQSLGVVISLAGVLVILTQGNLIRIFQIEYNKGDLIMLFAVVVWTLYSILGRRLGDIPPITATAVSALFATILMAPFAISQGIDVTGISSLAVIGIIYIVIFPSVCSFIFWNIAIRQIGPSRAGIFLNLMPVFTAIISWTFGEKITGTQVGGGIFVMIGVYLTTGMLDQKLANRVQV